MYWDVAISLVDQKDTKPEWIYLESDPNYIWCLFSNIAFSSFFFIGNSVLEYDFRSYHQVLVIFVYYFFVFLFVGSFRHCFF